MEHIEQLKKIRADAIGRIRRSSDFRLAGKLGLLIVELGETLDDTMDYEALQSASKPASQPHPFEKAFERKASPKTSLVDEENAIDELVAEIEGDRAELDALAAAEEAAAEETPDLAEDDRIGPFLKPDVGHGTFANGNGAAH